MFSHSSARALADVPRNVPDEILAEVGRTGGVVMVTFVPAFLTPAGAASSQATWAEARRLGARRPGDPGAVRAGVDAWMAEHPVPPATVGDVADHIDHVKALAGIDAVGIGSDFDGSPSMPEGLEDVSCFPNLFAELLDRGYAEDELAGIARGNVLRVMREAQGVSERLRASRPPSRARIEDMDGPLST